MAKKKPARAVPQTKPQAPVLHGDVFHTFIAEATSLGNEVEARRCFDADVVEFLRERGLLDAWTEWRNARLAR